MTEFQVIEELVGEVVAIKNTKDPEYIKSVLEGDKVQGMDYLVKIIKVDLMREVEKLEPGYIKSVLEGNLIQLDSYSKKSLLIGLGDAQYIKLVLDEERVKGLNQSDKVDLIKFTGDPKYIKSILEDNKVIRIDLLDLIDLVDLIKATGDVEYIKSILEENKIERIESLARILLIKEVEKFEPGYIQAAVIESNRVKGLEITDRINLIEEKMGREYIQDIVNDKVILPGITSEEKSMISKQLKEKIASERANRTVKDEIRNENKKIEIKPLELNREKSEQILKNAKDHSAIMQEGAINEISGALTRKEKDNSRIR